MKKILVLAMFFMITLPVFAVQDFPGYGCQGYYDLDMIFVEFYWKQGSTWYKIENDDIIAFKQQSTDEECFFIGNESDKISVSSSSVPCSAEVNSCWVFRDNSILNYNIYRAYIPTNSTSNIDMALNDNFSAITAARLENSIEETLYGPPPFYIASYRVTSMWDFNHSGAWDPTDSDWKLTTHLNNIDKKVRLWIYPTGYVYVWQDTGGMDAYNQFYIIINKSSSKSSGLIEMPVIEETKNDENRFYLEEINLDYVKTVEIDIEGMINGILKSAFVVEEKEPETVIKVNSGKYSPVTGLIFEKIDPSLNFESLWAVENQIIIAVNGILINDFESVEELLSYIMANDIVSFSIINNEMNILTFKNL